MSITRAADGLFALTPDCNIILIITLYNHVGALSSSPRLVSRIGAATVDDHKVMC